MGKKSPWLCVWLPVSLGKSLHFSVPQLSPSAKWGWWMQCFCKAFLALQKTKSSFRTSWEEQSTHRRWPQIWGKHQNRARLGWGWWQINAVSAQGVSFPPSATAQLLEEQMERRGMGKEWLIPTCCVVHMCILWHRLEVRKKKVVLLWRKKIKSLTIVSILIDARIKKYGYICSAQRYGIALSTLCSSVLFTYISKICM